jgi:hypothetical protein
MSIASSKKSIEEELEEVLSIDKKDLLINLKHHDKTVQTFLCKECIDIKTKKTKRLLMAIKQENDLTLKIIKTDDPNVREIEVRHPLFGADQYILHDKTTLIEIVNEEQLDKKIQPIGYVYILELEQNKYYVGKSSKPITRTGDHVASTLFDDKLCRGSGWTKMYKPIKILEIITSYDEFDEDVNTLKYMKKYGLDNVRGGSFCELNLNKENVNTLVKMLAGADDRCYYCGSLDHFIADCPQRNLKRIPKKQKKFHIKSNNIPKSKIMKFYGANQLLQNSDIKYTKNSNDLIKSTEIEPGEKHVCKYCKKSFKSLQTKTNHENIMCEKNARVKLANEIVADVDKILERNKHYLKDKKR